MKTSLTCLGVILTSMLMCESPDSGAKPAMSVCLLTATSPTPCPDKTTAPAGPAKPASEPTGKKPKREPRPARPEYLFL
jgi:hypothetical protein